MIAALANGDWLMFWRDVWPLIVPSILGAIIGGFFMKKIYQPLLLYIKYQDLADIEPADEKFQEEDKNAA